MEKRRERERERERAGEREYQYEIKIQDLHDENLKRFSFDLQYCRAQRALLP